MSYVDDFDIRNYATRDELDEARRDIETEISTLRGYLRGITKAIWKLEDEEEQKAQATEAER